MYLFHFALHLFQVLFNVLSVSWEFLLKYNNNKITLKLKFRGNIVICMWQYAAAFSTFFFFTPSYQPPVWYLKSEVSFHITVFRRCLCSFLRFRSSDEIHESAKGKKPHTTYTSAQLRGQGCQELCHLLGIWVLLPGLGEKDVFHYNLHNSLHHVTAVVFLCTSRRPC